MGKERLLSLDVFRGFTIAAMILVNDPGSWSHVYAPLLHAEWHGLTPTDLVFPFFIFMVGVSISLGSPKTGIDRKIIITKSLQRMVILFLIGLFLNGFPYFDLASLRIPGVLQRIALVFFACIWMYHHLDTKKQYYVGAVLLIGYWILMSFVPIPGGKAPNLEAGTNLAAWLDNLLLSGHMWSSTKTWDPEGVLSTFPAIVTGLIGIWTGKALFKSENKTEALLKLLVAGNLMILAALAWNMFFPINKALWTSSFVLATGGIAINCFAMTYWFLDVLKIRTKVLFPFQVFGTNAITVYVFAGVFSTVLWMIEIGGASLYGQIFNFIVSIFGDMKFSSLVFAILFVSVCYIPIWTMFKKGIFIKV